MKTCSNSYKLNLAAELAQTERRAKPQNRINLTRKTETKQGQNKMQTSMKNRGQEAIVSAIAT